jgi:hypothetical protein
MDDLIKSVQDEDVKKRMAEIAKSKGWSTELSAVAAKAGDNAVKIIEAALQNERIKATANSDREYQAIKKLQDRYRDAMQKGDVGSAIVFKNRLYQVYGVSVA